MPATIVKRLQEHRSRQDADRTLAGERWTISKQFHEHLKHARLPQRRFHDLRHSCATLLLVQGVSPRVVMDVLGHSQIGLTMNTYSHVIPELPREAAERMEDLLKNEGRDR